MKRSLVLLLVVALLAMMIPSIAMAEAKSATVAFSEASYTGDLKYYIDGDSTSVSSGWTKATLSNVVDPDGEPYYGYLNYEWGSEDDAIVRLSDSGWTYVNNGSATVNAPYMYLKKEGTTKAWFRLYSEDDEDSSVIYTGSVEVKVTKTKTEKIEVDKSYEASEFEMSMDDASRTFSHLFTVTPDNAYYGKSFKWNVSDPTVARVDKYGNVKPLKAGKFTLTATAKDNADAKASAEITVKEGKAKPEEIAPTLSFSTDKFTVKSGEYLNLEDYLVIENAPEGDQIYWTSSNPKIISIDKTDAEEIELKLPGTVTITARSKKFPTATATCEVTYEKEELKSINFTSVPKTIQQSDYLPIWDYVDTDPAYYTSYSYRNEIGWKSTDPQVAYIDSDGDLYGRKAGKATITAYYKDDENVKATFDIEVAPVPVTGIVFSKDSYTVKVGESYELSLGTDYRFSPKNYSGGYKTTWTSSDEEVATVYGGTITGQKAGTATITLSVRNVDETIVTKDVTVNVVENVLTGIAFKKDAYTVLLSNNKHYKNVTLKLTPADANFDADDLYVESSNPKVATAEIDGSTVELYAVAPGAATITVKSHSDEKLSAETKVTVKPILLTGVKMMETKKTVSIYEGGSNTTRIKTIIKPSDAYCKATWTTSDAGVAFVENTEYNEDGREASLVAVAPGTCTITVTVTDGTNTMKATMKVTVKMAKVAKLQLNKTKATVYMIKGGENTLQLIATDGKTGDEVPVTWTTANKKIATVDKTGLVTFKKAGKVKITATTKDGNKTKKACTLTIKQLKVTSIVPANKTLTMNTGATAKLKVTVKPAKAYNPAVSFKSSKPKIVSVDAEGNLKALKAGKAVITVTAKDGSKKSAKITVTVKAAAKNNALTIEETVDNAPELTIDGLEMDGIVDISDGGIDGEISLTLE